MNYAPDGPTFVPAIWSRPYTDFDRKAFYKDERFRETTFLVEALGRSACYRRGTVQCATCHDPHPVDAGTYPVPLKFRDNRRVVPPVPQRLALGADCTHASRRSLRGQPLRFVPHAADRERAYV
jgi:hypothetical protein